MYFRAMKKILGWALILIATQASAQHFDHYISDPDATPREHKLDVKHLNLNVKFNPQAGEVMGTVVHTFTPIRKQVDSVFWDAPDITINSVVLTTTEGKATEEVRFRISDDGVTTYFASPLKWDNTYHITFEYKATPQKGIYFIGWNSPKVTDRRNQTRQQIWTQGQGIDNRHWIPMYDNMNDKFITETTVTFNDEFKVLSNGNKLAEKKNKDGTKTWHYKMPHPHAGYLLMLAIDRYEVKETKTNMGTPIQFWYYPEHQEKVEPTSLHTEKIIEFLENETSFPYPWGAYSQVMVQDFMYGAMENTSATIFGDFFNVDENSFNDRNYVSVNAHEATHQWFGDLLTARSSRGTWLQESFATYYAKLFMKSVYGDDEYRKILRGEMNSALAASVNDNYPIAHTKSGTARVYPKGSTVLHMLRYVLGDEEYKRVIAYYVNKHAYGNVVTSDLELAIQDVLGLSLDWFFDQWLNRGGEPRYRVSYENYGSKTVMTVNQIQEKDLTIGLFKMPINCGIYFTDGSKVEQTQWIENETEHIVFNHSADKKIAYVLFDINNEVLKSIEFEKSSDEWIAQLKGAEHMIDRYDAVLGLRNVDDNAKRQALQDAFEKETFYFIKAEIVKQLADDSKSNFFLNSKLPQEDVRVKRVVVSDCKYVDTYKSVFESSLKDKSYSNQTSALQCLCEAGGESKDAYFERTADVIGQAHTVRITWLSYKIDQLKSDSSQMLSDKLSNYYRYLNELTGYSSNLYEFRTRINAMNSIKRFNYLSADAILNMMDASLSKNRRLAGPARSILQWYNEQYPMKKAIQAVYNQANFSDEDKKKLRDLGVVE